MEEIKSGYSTGLKTNGPNWQNNNILENIMGDYRMQNNKIYEKIKMIAYHTSLIFERNFREYFWNLLVAIKPRKEGVSIKQC